MHLDCNLSFFFFDCNLSKQYFFKIKPCALPCHKADHVVVESFISKGNIWVAFESEIDGVNLNL